MEKAAILKNILKQDKGLYSETLELFSSIETNSIEPNRIFSMFRFILIKIKNHPISSNRSCKIIQMQ